MRDGRALMVSVSLSSSTAPSLDKAGPASGGERKGRRGFMLLCLRFVGCGGKAGEGAWMGVMVVEDGRYMLMCLESAAGRAESMTVGLVLIKDERCDRHQSIDNAPSGEARLERRRQTS